MDTAIIVAIIVVAAIAVALVAWAVVRSRRSAALRQQFGPEYERAVADHGGRGSAESALRERRERVAGYEIRALSTEARGSFTRRWDRVQTRFVDDPVGAVEDADVLVEEVMLARGYPMANFDQHVEDLSVDHPAIVTNYREGHELYLAGRSGKASTEELRQGFVKYRALFAELLQPEDAEVGRVSA